MKNSYILLFILLLLLAIFCIGWLVPDNLKLKKQLDYANKRIELILQLKPDTVMYYDTAAVLHKEYTMNERQQYLKRIIAELRNRKPGTDTTIIEVPGWIDFDSLYNVVPDSVKTDSIDIWYNAWVYGFLSDVELRYKLKGVREVTKYVPTPMVQPERLKWSVWVLGSDRLQAGLDFEYNRWAFIAGYDAKLKTPVVGARFVIRK